MDPEIPSLNGVPLQTVFTVCERTFALGKIIKREEPSISFLKIMGMAFYFRQCPIYVQPNDMYPSISQTERFLTSEDWECCLTVSQESPSQFVSWVPGAGRVYNTPADILRWGKEGFFYLRECTFEGDVETFKSQMLYAMMLGGANDDWSDMNGMS